MCTGCCCCCCCCSWFRTSCFCRSLFSVVLHPLRSTILLAQSRALVAVVVVLEDSKTGESFAPAGVGLLSLFRHFLLFLGEAMNPLRHLLLLLLLFLLLLSCLCCYFAKMLAALALHSTSLAPCGEFRRCSDVLHRIVTPLLTELKVSTMLSNAFLQVLPLSWRFQLPTLCERRVLQNGSNYSRMERGER